MITKFFSFIRKPELWERTGEFFWDDEHISKGLLEAHLSKETEAASRNLQTIVRSVEWLSEMIPTGGNILDLGCGPGLYARRLTERGYSVTGIDFSRRSIAYAQAHDKMTEYIYKNYLEIDYAEQFDAVILIYCDYAALTPGERSLLLSKIHRALKPGGQFVFDVFTGQTHVGKDETPSWSFLENGGFWSPESHICLEATHFFENRRVRANQFVVLTQSIVREYLIWDTVYTKESLQTELEPEGFRLIEIYDDVTGAPFTGESDTMCAVFRK